MSRFAGSGGVRPSRAMSLMAAVVGLGMLLAVGSFLLGGPLFGIAVFFLTWAIAVISIIGYHLWNAFSPHGVDHTQFHFSSHEEQPGQPKARP